MSRNRFATVASLILALSFVSGVSRQAWAGDAKTQYPTMARLDQYLMADRNAEIALSRSAAPTSISGDATVLVLEKSGYQTAVEGKNGFTCLVERSWRSPFDSPEFWNPKRRGPICYNPAAVRTILPYTVNRTRLALTGLSKAQMRENITNAIAKNELPMPEAGAMSYMMLKAGNLGDSVGHWCPHLMFPRQTLRAGEQTWRVQRCCSTTNIAPFRSRNPFSWCVFSIGQTAPLRHSTHLIGVPGSGVP
jgi:hypothetical protein